MQDRGFLLTEQAHSAPYRLELLSPEGLIERMHQEDQQAVAAVGQILPAIAQVVQAIATRLGQGGRLFYVGAGTSGRLGVLDAAECPPTFCSDPQQVQGILAGGPSALLRSSEGLEDDAAAGQADLRVRGLSSLDAVVGITAGGTTPYVHGALTWAQEQGALTVFFACVPPEQVPTTYDLELRPLVGPEVLTGSTRLKAGTATKLVLNMISTGVMAQLGKVYDQYMVDVAVTNTKLLDRAIRILVALTGLERPQATELLDQAERQVKVALVMHHQHCDRSTAQQWLTAHGGLLRDLKA